MEDNDNERMNRLKMVFLPLSIFPLSPAGLGGLLLQTESSSGHVSPVLPGHPVPLVGEGEDGEGPPAHNHNNNAQNQSVTIILTTRLWT